MGKLKNYWNTAKNTWFPEPFKQKCFAYSLDPTCFDLKHIQENNLLKIENEELPILSPHNLKNLKNGCLIWQELTYRQQRFLGDYEEGQTYNIKENFQDAYNRATYYDQLKEIHAFASGSNEERLEIYFNQTLLLDQKMLEAINDHLDKQYFDHIISILERQAQHTKRKPGSKFTPEDIMHAISSHMTNMDHGRFY